MHFNDLLPERILKIVASQGYRPTGVLYPLNSYENRVYEIGVEGGDPVIGKFYRPERWGPETLAEEHRFLEKLEELEIPVVRSLELPEATSYSPALAYDPPFYYSLFPKFRGREHAENTQEDLRWLGRTLGRLHNVGERFSAPHRMTLNPETYGYQSLDFILRLDFLPADLRPALEQILSQALKLTEPYFQHAPANIVLHGDCHPGNVLWNVAGPHLLDFDDMIHAPPVQDLWMLFYGSPEERAEQRKAFFEGYEVFRPFDHHSLRLTEPLRTLRMIRHTAWIGGRHEEAIFQRAFPYYRERRYWEEFLLSLKEQIALLQEPVEWQHP